MISESLTGVYSKGDRVLCFYMHIVNDTYHVRIDEPTPPALYLGTPVPRQKVMGCRPQLIDKGEDLLPPTYRYTLLPLSETASCTEF